MRDREPKRSVGSLGQWQGGATPSRAVSAYWEGGSIPWVSPKDMSEDVIRHSAEQLTERGANRLKLYSQGDIAVVFRSGVLRHSFPVARGQVPFTVNQDLKVLHPATDVDAGYAFHLLRGLEQRVVNKAVKSGTTVESIDPTIFYSLSVYAPPLSEQRRISEILDTLDEAIRKTEQLIAKLKQVKQGLLHDLLTCGINENGELRDPERNPEQFKKSSLGRIPKAWEVVPFGALCESSAFGPRFPADRYAVDGPLATLRTTDMDEEGNIDLATMPRAAISPATFAQHILLPDDLLISRSGTCGIAAVFPGHTLDVVPGAFLIRFRLHQPRLSRVYRRYFNSFIGRPALDRLAVGGVQKNIKGSDVLALPVPRLSEGESKRVVQVIEENEASINSERLELNKLQLLKHGLMEDLLTGRVRVTPLLKEAAP
ncbi:restriction endonuclease subunit S [Archangium lansingense]|uniref:Restriction endonuclease subunit S n=1 Tax=Archangium lansingense TaxID=2995310 RepID=A0ABT4AQ48_9BACT|nr:restriction endonuclease subunit S [Archangium lansinium]MCY1082959.1 restriction endonuclease subunit S [Archangium lansinium]